MPGEGLEPSQGKPSQDFKSCWGWALAQSVLAAWWSYEDGEEDLDLWLACAKVFAKLE